MFIKESLPFAAFFHKERIVPMVFNLVGIDQDIWKVRAQVLSSLPKGMYIVNSPMEIRRSAWQINCVADAV